VGNAAERLGLHPNTLRFRMKKLGIVREDGRAGVRVASA
jgi:sugar diacid utilization regulator